MSETTASSPQVKISWIFWTLLAFTIFAVIAAYSSRMTNDYTDYDQKRADERAVNLAKLRETDHETLTTADWVDQGKGTVRIPIEEAMTRELVDLKAKPLEMREPVTPLPAANSVPASAAPSTHTAPVGATNAAPATNAPPSNPPAPKKETQ